MAELATLARPYATAVFELAVEADNYEQWSNNLNFLATVVADPTMLQVIANPKVDKGILSHIMLDVCKEQFDDVGKNLVKLLVENNRLPVIPEIVLQYELLKAQHQNYLNIEIASPYPVELSQQQEVESVLQKRLGKAVNVKTTIDKSLVGGWLIRAGDEVIDVSIKGRLQQLTTELRR